MKFSIVILALFLAFFQNAEISSAKIIESPTHSNWGRWFSWAKCPSGKFVHGFSLKTQKYGGIFVDDTSNNGIELYCDEIGSIGKDNPITSGMEDRGDWGSMSTCAGPVTGFQLRSESDQGDFVDDTAANNLRIFCNGDNSRWVEGNGLNIGDWTASQHCDQGQAVCGIQTQVEEAHFTLDETSLNNVRMECCDIQSPAKACTPVENWELVSICENADPSNPRTCKYEQRTGVSYSHKLTPKNAFAPLIYKELGFTLDDDIGHLKKNFQANFSKKNVSVYEKNWKREILQNSENIQVSPISTAEIYQKVANCGIYSIKSSTFKQIETTQNVVSESIFQV